MDDILSLEEYLLQTSPLLLFIRSNLYKLWIEMGRRGDIFRWLYQRLCIFNLRLIWNTIKVIYKSAIDFNNSMVGSIIMLCKLSSNVLLLLIVKIAFDFTKF